MPFVQSGYRKTSYPDASQGIFIRCASENPVSSTLAIQHTLIAQMLLTNPFTFEQWSWIAGIFSAALPTIIWLTSLTRKLFQSDQQIMDHAFHGVRIGASAKTLQKLKLKQINRSGSGAIKMIKWALPNGNELSVTYNSETDRVVYVEVDWCRKPSAFKTGLTKHKFGVTSSW